MKNLRIEATRYTPKIDFDPFNGILSITGKSYPENTFEYYKTIISWVKEYLKLIKTDREIIVNLDLEYLNSGSLKVYFDLLDLLESAHDNGKNIKINWIYDEENDIAEEIGEDFIYEFKNLRIELVVKDSNNHE